MSKPRKYSRAPPQPRKSPGRTPKVSKWPQKTKYQKVKKQKILQKEIYESIKPKPHPDTKKYHDRALKGSIQILWLPQIAQKGLQMTYVENRLFLFVLLMMTVNNVQK